MPQVPNFTCGEFEKALKLLGFDIDSTKGKGKHKKARAPKSVKITPGNPSFIMIPNGKTPGAPLKAKLISEFKRMGFEVEKLVEALKG